MKKEKEIKEVKVEKKVEKKKEEVKVEKKVKTVKKTKQKVKVVPLIGFDVWYSKRINIIPPVHHKTVILADFKARGLSEKETQENFDLALNKYGIKI